MTVRASNQADKTAASLTVHVPLNVKKRGGRRLVVVPASAGGSRPAQRTSDDCLLAAIARAYRWQWLFEGGAYQSLCELAAAEGIDRSYAGKVMRLTLLAPDLAEAILDAAEPKTMTLARLLAPFPVEWSSQRAGSPEQGRVFLAS